MNSRVSIKTVVNSDFAKNFSEVQKIFDFNKKIMPPKRVKFKASHDERKVIFGD